MSLARNRDVFPLLGITALVGIAGLSACHGSGASSPQEDEPETKETAATLTGTVEGYASATSVVQGGTLSFHASDGALTSAAPYPIQILRKGLSTTLMMSDATSPIKAEAIAADAYATGAGWPKVYDLTVGDTWPSGLYVAKIGVSGNFTTVPFVVRPKAPGSTSKVVFQLPINTTQAYNNWGGKSLYTFNSTNKAASVRVSFNRPTVFESRLETMLQWFEKVGRPVEFATSIDLHADAHLLDPYRLFVTVGHDEYWSYEMREHLDAFVKSGGNAAILSGNTMWWQVRFEPDSNGIPNRTMVGYRHTAPDPFADASRRTINWWETGWPSNTSIGLGGKPYLGDNKPVSSDGGSVYVDGSTFTAYHTDHWIYEDTGIAAGSAFGADPSFGPRASILGYETDGVDFVADANGNPVLTNGAPTLTSTDGTPSNLIVLGLADVRNWATPAWGAMGIFQNNGFVFNAGTTDWYRALPPCISGNPLGNPICVMTNNLLTHLAPLARSLSAYTAVNPNGTLRYLYTLDAAPGPEWSSAQPAFLGYANPPYGSMPIYRHTAVVNGVRKYQLSKNTSLGSSWALEKVAFHGFVTPGPQRVAVYAFVKTTDTSIGYSYRYSASTTPESGETKSTYPAFYVPQTLAD